MAFLRIRNNGKIKPLNIPEDQLRYLEAYLSSNIPSTKKQQMMVKIAGRSCSVCRGIPAHVVTYDVGGATVIERYCDNCVKSVYSREQVL